MSNSFFDEKAGIVSCKTEWGCWYQTVSEVVAEVEVEPGTRGKEIKIVIKPNDIECTVRGNTLFKGKLFSMIVKDDSTWTLEDQKLIRIQLIKADSNTQDKCWLSLLDGQYVPDPLILHKMRQKLDLERFQIENPGFDFSSAKLDKAYDDKGIKKMARDTNQSYPHL